MKELIKIDFTIYKPAFNENTGNYIDKSPYKPYERNCIRYECRCKAGASFINYTQFKQHIKSFTHKEFINNYSKYYKEVDESQITIKKLKVENELLKRKNNLLINNNNNLIEQNNILESEFKNIKNDNTNNEEFYECLT